MSARDSLLFSFLDRYASLAIGIVSSMVLARLLTPNEVGVFSVTMALLALVSTVRDMGAGQYLLQEKELSTDRIRAVWAVQLGIGLMLGLLVMFASAPIASFYEEPRMREIMLLLALNYVVNPLGSVTYAWLMREMRYASIAVVRFSATLSAAVVSVWLAWRGMGAISLAIGSVCGTVVNALASMLFRPKGYPWLPGLREVPRVLSFGTRVTSSSILNALAGGAPEYILGKVQGLTTAGLYSRANGLVEMFHRLVSDAVYSVALSLFSRDARENSDSSALFLKAFECITALAGAFAVGLAFLAHPVIRLLYGPQWDASADVVRVLAFAMCFACLVPLCGAVLIGQGRVSAALRATAVHAVAVTGLVAAASPIGMTAVAAALVTGSAIGMLVWLRATLPVVGVRWQQLRHAAARSASIAAASSAGPALVFLGFGSRPDHPLLPLLLGACGSGLGFLVAVRIHQHPLNAELMRMAPATRRMLSARFLP